MAQTSFGNCMGKLKEKTGETSADLARALGVSPAFFSVVENGKKNVPADWEPRLAMHFGLSDKERAAMAEAIAESRVSYTVQLKDASPLKRKVAKKFKESFPTMSEETANGIIEILGEMPERGEGRA